MNTRCYMVIIKGEIKTSEIMSCGYNRNTQKWDVKFNNGKTYSYAYLNVEKLTDPEVLNPNMYRISREGREFFDVNAIYVFRSGSESYWHICFGDGSERDYRRNDLHIIESCLAQSQSSNVFEYIKQIAGLSNLKNEETGEKLLSKKFDKENIIISTVDDEISDFADDPYLINVAVSRAKKKLMLVVTGNEQSKEHNITDLIDYIQYNNFEVTESKIYSIFDYLYKQYTEERRVYLQKHKKVSEYDSENLMYSLIEDIISANKYSSLDVVCHFPLNMLIKNPELLNEQECQYAMNPATHLDFLIYNRIGKKPVLAIEVDGYEYHKEDTVQASRDLLKNHIMELYEVPLLRFMTNGSGEKEKIIEMLDKLVG